MSPFHVMLLTHCFTAENSYKQTVVEASVVGAKLSKGTIADWFILFVGKFAWYLWTIDIEVCGRLVDQATW